MQVVGFVIATLIPLVTLYVIYALDLYKMGAFRTVLLCFAWGGIAFLLARTVNRYVYFQGLVTLENIPRYFAPVAEELLKALILVYLVRRQNFTYFVDGAIYGFAIGIGFAIFENYEYILANSGAGFGTAVSRVISTNLIHASATALVGVAFGLARFRRTAGHFIWLATGLCAAILLHGLFNNVVTRDIPGPILLYSAILGFAGVGLVAFLILRGLAEQRQWIEEKLGGADRVTRGEARLVHQLADVHEILEPLRQIFGEEKADQIEEFLTAQARLGILRKTLDKLPDEKMRRGVEKQMDEMRLEMDKARRLVGSYAMLYVRKIFPEEGSPLWGLMENRIQERVAARPTSGGANLFASLGQRMAERSAAPDEDISTRPDEKF